MNAANVCSSGSLVEASSYNGFAIVTGPGLKPGEGRRGEVTIVNLGPLPTIFRLSEAYTSSDFAAGHLALEIREFRRDRGRRIFLGEIGAVPAAGIDLDRFEGGESRTYRFTLLLKKDAPDDERRRSARAAYKWNLAWPVPDPN